MPGIPSSRGSTAAEATGRLRVISSASAVTDHHNRASGPDFFRERLNFCANILATSAARHRSSIGIQFHSRALGRIVEFDANRSLEPLFEFHGFQLQINNLFSFVDQYARNGIIQLHSISIYDRSASPAVGEIDRLCNQYLNERFGKIKDIPREVSGSPLARIQIERIGYAELGLIELDLLAQYREDIMAFSPEQRSPLLAEIDLFESRVNRDELVSGEELYSLGKKVAAAKTASLRAAKRVVSLADLLRLIPGVPSGIYLGIAKRASTLEAYVAGQRTLSLQGLRNKLERPEDPSERLGVRGEVLGLSTLIGPNWQAGQVPNHELLAIGHIVYVSPSSRAARSAAPVDIEIDAIARQSTTGTVAAVEIKADLGFDTAYFLHQFAGVGGTSAGRTKKDVCQLDALNTLLKARTFGTISEFLVLCPDPASITTGLRNNLRTRTTPVTVDDIIAGLESFSGTLYIAKTGMTLTQDQVMGIGQQLRRQFGENTQLLGVKVRVEGII